MRRAVFALVLAAMAAPLPALASGCSYGAPTVPDDGSAFSVLLDTFEATTSHGANCGVSLDLTNGGANPIAPGTIIAYSADYRGFVAPNSTARFSVTNAGTTSATTLKSTDDKTIDGDVFYSQIVGTRGTTLDSDISTRMLTWDDPGNLFDVDTIDYKELARTTPGKIQTSVTQLAANHTSLMTQLGATADLLAGAGQKLDAPDGFGGVGGFGSFSAGLSGRRELGNGFTVLGGGGVLNQSAGGAAVSGLLVSGALRYLVPDSSMFRPFAEAGLRGSPVLDMSFTRQVSTSTGTQDATGSAVGQSFGGYIKGGVLVAPDLNDEIVFSASVGKDWLNSGPYSEVLSTGNTFAASGPAALSSFDTVKVGIDWTVKVTPRVDVTLSGALGRTIAEDGVVTDVAFAGAFSGAPRSENFAEYGARVGYALDASNEIGAFVHGATGEYSGTHVQVGGDFHVRF